MRLNFDTLFSKYITQPWSPELSLGEKILATISLVAFTILTVGLIFPMTASLRGRKIDPLDGKDKGSNKEVVKIQAALKSLPNPLQHLFNNVDSHVLIPAGGKRSREDFLDDPSYRTSPPVLSKSAFVPDVMVEHLMRRKKDSALGVKYKAGDFITNMEGAMHTFLTPVTKIVMTGDYKWSGFHGAAMLNGGGREVILSAAIHPDFEKRGADAVVMPIVALGDAPLEGAELPEDFAPLASMYDSSSEEFKDALPAYEEVLKKHMVYHLTKAHRLPARSEVEASAMTPEEANELLSRIIKDEVVLVGEEEDKFDPKELLVGKYVNMGGQVVSLEAFYAIYQQQVINEFSVLEGTLPQGYVYTIDPPSIFASAIGIPNVALLNRLQLLALKELNNNTPLANLKVIGFNDYADPECLELYKNVFESKEIVAKRELFRDAEGKYSGANPHALVEHNNSDAFGQNIETEGPGSKDGVIGTYSDAAHHLLRHRPDLVNHIV